VLNYYSQAADQVLCDLIRHELIDAVQIQGVHLFKYFETIKNTSRRLPVLVDWHNIESELMARYASQTANLARKIAAYRTAPLLRRAELQMLAQASVHAVVSEREKRILQEWVPDADIRVIANGVDTNGFGPAALQQFKSRAPDAPQTLLFVGSMDYHANIDAVVWFAQTIWPQLSEQFPALHFTIAGRQPAAAVRALASDRIHVTGTVNDIREQYANAFAVVVPLRVGGGTRLKILEAMAAGVPVISTALGAEGISVNHNENVLISDTPDDFRSAVDLLIKHPSLRLELVRNARALVVNNYDWAALGARLIDIYKQLE
jgi:glycosyltransferase involved in cell wall biosynthesis